MSQYGLQNKVTKDCILFLLFLERKDTYVTILLGKQGK
jgi:hypothetical protein